MKSKIIGLAIAGIIIAAIAMVVFGTETTSPYWETKTSFGMWQDTVLIEFADGTTESLKIIQEGQDSPQLSVEYNNRDIERIGLEISASVTGVGYTGATLKYDENFGARRTIVNPSGGEVYSGLSLIPDGTTQNIPLGTTAPILTTWITVSNEKGTGLLDNELSGMYTAIFTPQGRAQYKGYPDGDSYQTVALMPQRSVFLVVTNTPANTIVELSSYIIYD